MKATRRTVRWRSTCLFLSCVATLALPFAPCAGAVPQDRAPDPSADDAVLSIDGQPISSAEYGMWLIRTQGEHMAREYAENYYAVDREAKLRGVDLSDEDVSKEVEADFVERIRGAFFGNKADWLKELDRTGRTESGLRVQRNVEYRPYLQARALANIDRVVPPEKIRREWERIYGRNGRHYDVRMMKFKVVVPSYPEATRDQWKAERELRMKEQRDKAQSVRERLLSGESFEKLAAQFSTDPDTRDHKGAPSDGFSHVGWPANFLDALEKVGVGEISEPLYGRGGYWLVKVLAVEETPLERVRDEIEADLARKGPEPDEIGVVQERLRQGVSVKVLPTMYTDREGSEWPSAYEPALEIDGEPVRRGTYARWIRDTVGETFVRLFVEERAVQKRARELGIDVTEAAVEQRAREYIQFLIDSGSKGDRESWRAFLVMGGRTEDSLLRDVVWRTRIDLLTEKMILRDRKVTPEQVRTYFADVYGTDGRRIEVRLIQRFSELVGADPQWSRDVLVQRMAEGLEAARVKIVEVERRARAGEDFAALARECSQDEATRAQGGKLADRFRADVWSDAVSAKILPLKLGEISEPIEFGGSWFLFQIADDRKVTFAEVEKELTQELITQRPSAVEVAGVRNTIAKQSSYAILPGMSK